ncbi:Kelch repeat-containing protein [Longispora albida]|uniref:Kelch repeat-containing protein n=1 Tax=Longispora albida TaxID=203523 RepID=UPI0003A9E3D3|nr:kelch repeat-containing protein [Longispora albida]
MAIVHARRILAPPALAAATVLAMLGASPAPAVAATGGTTPLTSQNSNLNVAGIGTVSGYVYNSSSGAAISGARVEVNGTAVLTQPDGRYSLTAAAGSQTIEFSAYGFAPLSTTVDVTEDGTVTKSVNLTPAPSVKLSGVVKDASGHGYPLYAKVQVVGQPSATYTNPATGEYTLSVPKGVKTIIAYTPVYGGYSERVVTMPGSEADIVQDAPLKVDGACTAAGYKVNMGAPVLSETFDGGTTPAGWTVTAETTQGNWVFNDPKPRGNLTGGTGGFAIADSDFYGSGKHQDTSMLSPVFDLTSTATPVLRFNSDYRTFTRDTVDVDITTDGGATWVNLWHRQAGQSQRGPVVNEVSLADFGGQPAAQLRFKYVGTYDYWWQVDNVTVQNRSCDPVAGGLVVGNVSDVNTGSAVNGAAVASVAKPAEKATTAGTPDDPNLADGFFWLFSSATGSTEFSVAKAGYVKETPVVNVAADGAVRSDSALKAPRLAFDSPLIEAWTTVGSNRNAYVSVKNTGSAPVDVTLGEQAGTVTPTMNKPGAGVRTVVVAGGVSKGFVAADGSGKFVAADADKERSGVTHTPASLAPVADGSWSDVASYPSAISDNSATAGGGKVYSVGGNSDGPNTRKIYIYDRETNAWSAGADMPTARSKPQVAYVGGKVYAFGGFGASGNNSSVDVYDAASNTWSTLGVTNPAPKAGAGVAVIGTKIYLVGGCANSACDDTSDVVVFDTAAGTFGTAAAYPHGVSWTSCAGLGGKAVCAGGAADSAYKDGYSYDPGANAWTAIADLPIDLWGSSDAAANGQLVLMGGITGNSTMLTNRSFAYDPAGNTWAELPEARVPTARGAGACGAYKIGGWTGPFTPSAGVEALAGFDQCGTASGGDVPWLATTPATFTLQPGKSQTVLVAMTAKPENGIDQPGDYTATLSAGGVTPYAAPKTDVLLHAQPPSGWGKITGTVTGTPCGGSPVPVPATVQLNGSGSNQFTLKASVAGGKFTYWVPRGKYQIIVAKDGWIPQARDVSVPAGLVTTADFSLRPVSSCGSLFRDPQLQ